MPRLVIELTWRQPLLFTGNLIWKTGTVVTKKAYLMLFVVRMSQITLKEDGCLPHFMAAVGRNCYTAACCSLNCPAFLVKVFAVNPNERQKVACAQMRGRKITSLLSIKPLLASSYCSFPALPRRHPVCCRKGGSNSHGSLRSPLQSARARGRKKQNQRLCPRGEPLAAGQCHCDSSTVRLQPNHMLWHPRQVRRRQRAGMCKGQKLRRSVQRKHFPVYLKAFSSATHRLNAAAPVRAHTHQPLSSLSLKNNTTTTSLLLGSKAACQHCHRDERQNNSSHCLKSQAMEQTGLSSSHWQGKAAFTHRAPSLSHDGRYRARQLEGIHLCALSPVSSPHHQKQEAHRRNSPLALEGSGWLLTLQQPQPMQEGPQKGLNQAGSKTDCKRRKDQNKGEKHAFFHGYGKEELAVEWVAIKTWHRLHPINYATRNLFQPTDCRR